jgi:photosystem II stability/assembly factor-like uncharacterized protein
LSRYIKQTLYAGLLIAIVAAVFFSVRRPPKEPTGEWKILHQFDLMHGPRLSQVKFFDRNNGIVVNSGAIGLTSDGGKSWIPIHASEDHGYYSFAFADARNGIAVGSVDNEVPFVLRTTDAGRSWQTLNLDPQLLSKGGKVTNFLDACFDSKGKSWIVGSRGIVSANVVGTRLNITSVHPTTDILYGVACAQNGQIWAVGQGTVLSNGNGWQKKQFDQNYYFGKVRAIGKDIWLLGGIRHGANSGPDSGVLLRSNNSGETWEDKMPKSQGLPYDLFKSDDMLWLVGAGGQIHFSKNNGDSWETSPTPTNADLLSVYFLDKRNGWISGDRGTVLIYSR